MNVKIACIQMEPVVGDKANNVQRSVAMIEQAAAQGAQLIVLPELCNSGYVFESVEEARALAEAIPDGPTVDAWAAVAAKHNLHLVAGIDEADAGELYNSSVVIGPQGYIGTFRKVHLWNQENRFFTPGNLGFPVFDTAVGRLGSAICYDGWFPETFRECALNRADIICVPTNWVPINGQREDREAMANILVMGAAHSNSVFIACADRIGVERSQPFIGQSMIVDFTGWPIGGPASADQEEIILGDADLSDPARHAAWNEFNHNPVGDRRPAQYTAASKWEIDDKQQTHMQ